MAFTSLPFLVFIGATVLVYYLVPKKFRWFSLLLASYIFFFINSEWLILFLFGATVVSFSIALWIHSVSKKRKAFLSEHQKEMSREEKKAFKNKTKTQTRWILTLGILVVLGILLVLKYFNFFAETGNLLLNKIGITIPTFSFLLPLGISFYTLQAIAYMVDVYRNKIQPDTNLLKHMLFMSYFPQIVQGPIQRYSQLAKQLYEGHDFHYENLTRGCQLIMWGFFKKLVIADRIAVPVNAIFNNSGEYSGIMILIGAVGYGLQIYADFSGGMDIARGVSNMLGIELELNFKQPYFSSSIEDFWRRWHITLGGWMRDYIFYPLSLSKAFSNLSKKSRKVFGAFVGKRLPAFLAMFIVYFLVGIWHGPESKYVAYGIYNGLFIMAGILLEGVYDKGKEKCHINGNSFSWRAFQMFRTFLLVSIGRLFSRAGSFTQACNMMGSLFKRCYDLSPLVDGSLVNLGLNTANWILLLFAVLVLFFVDLLHERGIQIRNSIAKQNLAFRWALIIIALFVIIIFGIWGPHYDAASFIYEKF